MPSPKRTISLGQRKPTPQDIYAEAEYESLKEYTAEMQRLDYNRERTLILRDNTICYLAERSVSGRELARLSNVSRQQVYNIVQRGQRAVPPEWSKS